MAGRAFFIYLFWCNKINWSIQYNWSIFTVRWKK